MPEPNHVICDPRFIKVTTSCRYTDICKGTGYFEKVVDGPTGHVCSSETFIDCGCPV